MQFTSVIASRITIIIGDTVQIDWFGKMVAVTSLTDIHLDESVTHKKTVEP